ncbi:MAG: hypothetical protein JXR78_07510 [Victivallales bacterium]|nr:hypothetical protein [Victivallales bacterium]
MSRISELKTWVEARNVKTDSVDKTKSLNSIKADALRVSGFVSDYWSAAQDRPGLENAGLGLSKDILASIDYEVAALDYIREGYINQLQLDADKQGMLDRGEHLLFEFETFLDWYIVSSDSDVWDERIEETQTSHPDTDMDSLDDLAHTLFDYAELTKEILACEKEVGGISLKTVEEAMTVVSKLVDLNSSPIPVSDEAKELLTLKFQLVAILQKDIEKVRKAAHFVFRHHPKILGKVASTFLSTQKVTAYRVNKIKKLFSKERKKTIPMRFLPRY